MYAEIPLFTLVIMLFAFLVTIASMEFNLFHKILIVCFAAILIWLTTAYNFYEPKYQFVSSEKAETHKSIAYVFTNKKSFNLNEKLNRNIIEGENIFIFREKQQYKFLLIFGNENNYKIFGKTELDEFIKDELNQGKLIY